MDEFRKYKPMVYVCSPYSGDTQFNTACSGQAFL